VQHIINSLQRFTILPNITNNLGSSDGKTFFVKSKKVSFKIKKERSAPQH
jgi:hypothetical protein